LIGCLLVLPQVAHALRLVSFFALQLPIFTYLITQFQVGSWALADAYAVSSSSH
jgi:hypothetical protein